MNTTSDNICHAYFTSVLYLVFTSGSLQEADLFAILGNSFKMFMNTQWIWNLFEICSNTNCSVCYSVLCTIYNSINVYTIMFGSDS